MTTAKNRPSAHPFHVMLKPAGAACNLACQYCYYLDKAALYPEIRLPRMSDNDLERFVINLIASQPEGVEVVFSWQGGEPTLLGIDFYRRAVELQRQHGAGRQIMNTFQTNGTFLDDEWCRFFAAERFLVGLSLDGPAEIHDHYRRYASGRPSHAKVMDALRRLQSHAVEFNLLSCVNRLSAVHPLEMYEFLCSTGAKFIQFIPVVERHPESGEVTEWSVRPDDYGDFMVAVFDRWVERDSGDLVVMNFEWALANSMGLPGSVCHHQPICGRSLAVEYNGDVYACDHFVDTGHRLGSSSSTSLAELVDSPQQISFGRDKLDSLPESCMTCPVLRACWGGCPKHRFATGTSGQSGVNYLCSGYDKFFKHVAPVLKRLARSLT